MNTLQQSNDLPSAVRKRLDYFPQLLDRLSNAPLWDFHEILDTALIAYKEGEKDRMQGLKFTNRLKHYLATTPMEPQRRERIENWAFWTKGKESKFLDDLAMPEWKEVVTEADRAAMEERLEVIGTIGRPIIERDKALGLAGKNAKNMEVQIAQLEKRLSELNAARALNTPAATPPLDTPAPDKGGTHIGYTLDTAAPTAPDLTDVWASLLCKNVVYTLADLDRLLVSLGLLTDAASRNPTADFKGSAVLGPVKALRERRYLRAANDAKLARLLAARYGSDVANPHTVKRGTNQLPESASPFYTCALALLPAP